MTNQLQTGVYRHYKGRFYRVLGFARHSETEEEMVVYQALYGAFGWWVRPKAMFFEMVKTADGICRRFEYVGDEIPEH